MNLNPSHKQQTKLRVLSLIKYGALGLLLAGILYTTTTHSDYYNDGIININPYEIHVVGIDMINDEGGTFVNNGQTYYRESIVNDAIMDCGDCTSGANYISNSFDYQQTIEGSQPIKWYDGILDNAGGLLLENELQITNSFSFTDGMIETDRTNPDHFLHFLPGAVSNNTSASRHVDGYVGKTGNTPFMLPTGDGNRFMPVGVDGVSSTDFFKAAYYNSDPSTAEASMGGPFNRDMYDDTQLELIPLIGFWDISGTGTTPLNLYWDESSQLDSWVQGLDTLTVIGWDGSQWVNLGNNGTNGTLSSGYIISDPVIPSNYQAFALGKGRLTPFPVEWLSFTARLQGSDGFLEWTTAREENAQYFDIQRSLDGIIFESIGETPAIGNSNQTQSYDFTDEGIATTSIPKFYYRLKEVDFDGVFQYSKVVELTLDNYVPNISMNIYPNPTSDFLNVQLSGPRERDFDILIINQLGQTVYQGKMNGSGQERISVSPWSSGNYYIIAQDEELKATKQLIISR